MEYLREEMGKRMRRYASEMESLRDKMSQTMDKYANEMPPLREEMDQRMADYMEYLREEVEYELPAYSSTSVIYPFES